MDILSVSDHVTYFGGAFFSFYVVGSERAALLELGISQTAPVVERVLKRDIKVSPTLLVAMHSHYDHVGGALRLKSAFPDAALAAGVETAKALADPDHLPIYRRAMQKVSGNPLFEAAFPGADDMVEWDCITVDRLLPDGDTIQTGAGDIEVLAAPGHSPCSLALFHRNSGALFVSDTCGMPLPSGRIWPTAFDDVEQYIASMKRMIALAPQVVCPGHFRFFGNGRAVRFLERSLRATEHFFERIHKLVDHFGDEEDLIMKQLRKDYDEDVTFIQDNILRHGNRTMVRQVLEACRT